MITLITLRKISIFLFASSITFSYGKTIFGKDLNTKNRTNNETIITKNIVDKITTEDKFGIKINNLFTKIDQDSILNINYDNIKYDNFGFLENEEELDAIKHILKEQQDPELRKISEEKDRLKQEIRSKIKNFNTPIERSLKIYSLVFLDENNWEAKINHEIFNNKNKNKKTLFDTGIVKVDNNSIIFLVKKTDDLMVKKVQLIKKRKLPYSNNYYLVKKGKKTYVAFKLFNGQKIKLDTMIIIG